ncbi:MAG: DUF924 domain-containing protein [Rhodanobacteraceae bacterium]|nr:DUF924 domain-containing protein [Xanthomonadales bacterium]MCP5479549.1 DUF924 domain-containing protein [Rhodanobacteraceae bacterium]HPF74221.1 DUF924 family protein [Xanthomonadaceae bacterium]HRX99020.1 DUF924 family protein [Xanthomonadaceae bacterium]
MHITPDTTPEEVLLFWFGDSDDEARQLAFGMPRWFNGGDALDLAITEQFEYTVRAAHRGDLDAWAETAQGRLALIVLIDQFSRNVYRGKPGAFVGDDRCQRLALDGLRLGHDRQLTRPQRVFFYLPLEHAENLSLQHMSVALFASLIDEAPASVRGKYASFHDFAERHRRVIRKFGRFPHRNAALNRESTSEETAYLAKPGAGF